MTAEDLVVVVGPQGQVYLAHKDHLDEKISLPLPLTLSINCDGKGGEARLTLPASHRVVVVVHPSVEGQVRPYQANGLKP